MKVLPLLIFSFILYHCISSEFTEDLVVFPLADGNRTLAYFQFTIDDDSVLGKHYGLFPRNLGDLAKINQIEEFRLSLTKGRWDHEKWGLSPQPAPLGAEIIAYYDKASVEAQSLQRLWKKTVYSLGGIFCTSLESLYVEHQSQSLFQSIRTFKPFAQTDSSIRTFPSKNYTSEQFVHGVLPGETVCTENLTPWIKLLPNRGKSGIANLLSMPSNLYKVDHHSLGVHYDGVKKKLHLTLVIVFNKHRLESESIFKTLGIPEIQACPLASKSIVHTVGDASVVNFVVPSGYQGVQNGLYTSYDLTSQPFTLELKRSQSFSTNAFPWINVNRWLVGWGQQYGTQYILLENHMTHDFSVHYLQTTPWTMRTYLHTLKLYQDGVLLNASEVASVINYSVSPASDRISPTRLEFDVKMKKSSKLLITIEYDTAFMHFSEHSPDPQRGYEIGAGVLSVKLDKKDRDFLLQQQKNGFVFGIDSLDWTYQNHSEPESVIHLYTGNIIVKVPTPDFSMPYNVIIFTCTMVALFFGTLITAINRDYGEIYRDGRFVSDRKLVVVLRRIKGLIIK